MAGLEEGARLLAQRVHAGQRRKADGRPYLAHVGAVADTLANTGFTPEVLAAALLHDAVEHTDVEPEEIDRDFGAGVAMLVAAMTDRSEIEPWVARKQEHRERVALAGRDACAIYAADKLEGVREARSGYAEVGEDLEERLGNTLGTRFLVWDADVRMLETLEEPLPFIPLLREELILLSRERGGDRQTSDAS